VFNNIYYVCSGFSTNVAHHTTMTNTTTPEYIENLNGSENLHKYPKPFIKWIKQPDSWAITYVHKYKITKLITLFELWINESY
ncbi:MAG: hypothetical protein V4651_08585, partial [Bacteroidota bacterium]